MYCRILEMIRRKNAQVVTTAFFRLDFVRDKMEVEVGIGGTVLTDGSGCG